MRLGDTTQAVEPHLFRCRRDESHADQPIGVCRHHFRHLVVRYPASLRVQDQKDGRRGHAAVSNGRARDERRCTHGEKTNSTIRGGKTGGIWCFT